MKLKETPEALLARFSQEQGWQSAINLTRNIKAKCLLWQRAFIYSMARQWNRAGGHILEIGTLYGSSAGVIAYAATRCAIITITPAANEVEIAERNLRMFWQVKVVLAKSADYLAGYHGPELDLIFVDGDHDHIADDLPWFNWLRVGGLMLFHDYSPANAAIPCPPVYAALNAMAAALGRDLDYIVQDTDRVGMAGVVRREGETWPMQH